MVSEQITKRVEWLDDERRKDKNTIAQLKDRVAALEGKVQATEHENKELESEVTRLKTVVGRMDRLDEAIAQNRTELTQWIDKQKKSVEKRDEAIKQMLQTELNEVDSLLEESRESIKTVSRLRDDHEAREQEEKRLSSLVESLQESVEEVRLREEELSRSNRVIEDTQKQEAQKLTDVQGELSALRKRSDEYRGRFDVFDAEMRRLESRLKELLAVERERVDTQEAFIERQNSLEAEREKTWKDWKARFTTIEEQSVEAEEHLQSLEETHLEAKRVQETVTELGEKVERRLDELTELQRLSEERFRQEWNTFKSDDQKRWTNYMLSHEEEQSDFNRKLERSAERITLLEDSLQEMQDFLQEVNQFSWKRLHSILEAFRDWTADHERLQGGLR